MKRLTLLCAALCTVQTFATPAHDEATVTKHAAVARRAAGEGMVLLKNEGGALPLAKGSRVALFGAHGDYLPGGAGWLYDAVARKIFYPLGGSLEAVERQVATQGPIPS